MLSIKNLDSNKRMNNTRNRLSMGKDRTRVIFSTCESPSHESRTAINIDTSSRRKCSCSLSTNSSRASFRRRVSFNDAILGGDADDSHRTNMQNDLTTSSCRDNYDNKPNDNEEQTFYDIWQADDLINKSDGGYENMPKITNHSKNCVSDCVSNKGWNSLENVDEAVVNDELMQSGRESNNPIAHSGCVAESTSKVIDDTISNENVSHLIKDSIGYDEYRMRGGCREYCGMPHNNVRRSSQNHSCSSSYCCCCCCYCEGFVELSGESCASESVRCDGGVKTTCSAIATCSPLSSLCCCCRAIQRCRRAVCKKTIGCNEMPACTTSARSCSGGSGHCGGGCCGGCRKSNQICMSSSPTRSRPQSSQGRLLCARPCCPARSLCRPTDRISGYSDCDRVYEYGSPRCRSTIDSGCCISDRAKCGTDGVCCRLKFPIGCECLGGGLDCRRCGKKVYQAEMQIVSGVPFHSICFSCFCCRKPLEPLTYQENCGEIYCKQCYVRNFGPQGYGYGAGAGVLQTPL